MKNDEYPISTCCQDKDHIRDTVFNVALTVGSHLEDIVEKIKNRHGIEQILVPLCSISDCRLAVIKSCCGNVIHTLLDKKTSFKGFEEVNILLQSCAIEILLVTYANNFFKLHNL